MDITAKKEFLKRYTESTLVIDELCAYTANKFTNPKTDFNYANFNLPDEDFISVWQEYYSEAKEFGVFEALKKYLVQLQFPIRKNSSQAMDYRAATLRGQSTEDMAAATGLELQEPDTLELIIHQSSAGKIPVLIVSNNDDFVSLIQALTYRNEPVQIPNSMGAAMINGLNNWDRIYRQRKKWSAANPFGNWNKEFTERILPNKSRYQDKLIVLSKKRYSGVSAEIVGQSPKQWIENSLQIRLEHECAHFFTLKVFGAMANNIYDELIADYMGITKVLGKFDCSWFLSFVGLENYPEYRDGARLQNYLGDPPLSSKAVVILRTLVKKAAVNLELFDADLESSDCPSCRVRRLLSICSLDLVDLSRTDACENLRVRYETFGQITQYKTSVKV